ncbi:hypothetical protein [Marinobacterium aestuariivivens]|uniref:Uncharacterized protein n=1 Tax=Marinobacterium aestuariivivens TaxID=1698799 RepID=A0ABW2A5Y3_9GAMM
MPADEAGSDYRQRLLALSSLPPPTLSDSEREQRLTALFERFSRAIDSGNLVLPATDSAAEYLLRMTALGAGHPRLLEARSRLAQAFLEEARRARLAGDWDAADRWLQHAVEIRLSLEDLEAEQDSRD